MRHMLWIQTQFGDLCAGCGRGVELVEETCSLSQIRDEVAELFHWQREAGKATNFTALLYTLFQKADAINTMKLANAFPKHQAALTLWKLSDRYGEELFEAIGLVNHKTEERDEHEDGHGIGSH